MSSASSYSPLDRLLHRVAFSGKHAQIGLADIERQLFKNQIDSIAIKRPVFITALARAGTTILLEMLCELPEFAHHTYRNMPFILCPMLWEKVSCTFRKNISARERAHGDGVIIDANSPEAFEEVIWKTFWPRHYLADRINIWSDAADRSVEFEEFLRDHMRKIIALGRMNCTVEMPTRYISKNNANISRIGLLSRMFSDCIILVPVRDPWRHSASLLRQHKRFVDIHTRDDFARQYMEWLGHHEFGASLRPIDFDGWLASVDPDGQTSQIYWLKYWLATYRHILNVAGPNLYLVDYEGLCCNPQENLTRLADILLLDDSARLMDAGKKLLKHVDRPESASKPNTVLTAAVETLYSELLDRCI